MVSLTCIFNTSVLITNNLLLSKYKNQLQFRYHRFVYFILRSVIFVVIMLRLHPDIRNQAIGMLAAGMLACNIARRLGVHRNTIIKLASNHRLRGLVTYLPRAGPPRVTTTAQRASLGWAGKETASPAARACHPGWVEACPWRRMGGNTPGAGAADHHVKAGAVWRRCGW